MTPGLARSASGPASRRHHGIRALEIGSGALLLVLLVGILGTWGYRRMLDRALAAMLEEPNLEARQLQEVHKLLARGASIYTTRYDRYNLLMLAGRNRDLALLRQGLRAGIDVNGASDYYGWTPLMEAVSGGDMECARELLAAGADPNARDRGRKTPLMYAADANRPEMARLLLASGARIDARNRNGHTALAYACTPKHRVVARLLRQAGALD